MRVLKYDTVRFNFAPIVEDWFGVNKLQTLHTIQHYDLLTRKKDQSTHWHTIFYEKYREDKLFYQKYQSFLEKYIKPLYNEDIVYQTIPSFRVQLSDNVAVGEWHKDKDYRDIDWALKVKEMNYYLPLTDTNTLNTIWAESKEDKKDYKPILANYGECVEWDASNLTHGNKKNISDTTRVSVDFRVISKSRYIPNSKGSINTNTSFEIGNYYSVL